MVLSNNELVTPMSGLHEMYREVFSQGSIIEEERSLQPLRDLNPQSSDPSQTPYPLGHVVQNWKGVLTATSCIVHETEHSLENSVHFINERRDES